MTTAADTETRYNPHRGAPCPSWCRINHAEPFQQACVGSGGSVRSVWTKAVLASGRRIVTFCASLPDVEAHWPSIRLDLREAEDVAIIVDMLAEATPDEHRELAAAIRKAAADIKEAGQ